MTWTPRKIEQDHHLNNSNSLLPPFSWHTIHARAGKTEGVVDSAFGVVRQLLRPPTEEELKQEVATERSRIEQGETK